MADNHSQKPDRDQNKEKNSKELDKEVKDTFPASDPPSSTQPGSGITGAEDKGRR
ncbi:hypothetical protein GCM10007276_09250 [Agaricicola taiwanensis]|uniref:Uncharacterized protein n=1 Tax=Agaricicola taiwanensis TaxID=591372 RepID=A0A8J2VK85_9RHOB|nr:hypothetical protein [Agaricicola taiwanensis]GGE34048.1 hypothetical protein GCM10007276_09250 [Agaricicola taiwanensis]